MPKGRAIFSVLSLCATLVIGAAASADSPRISFGDVVARLYADKTFVVSPTSLNVVLHIAKDASRGKTADEISPLLFDDNLDEQFPRPGTDVSILNASGVWISSRYPGSAEFNALFVRKYGGTVSRVSFQNGEGEDAVGNWIAKLSKGDLHGLRLNALTQFVIANVQVFEGAWAHPFYPALTRDDTFNGRNGKEPIRMMSWSGPVEYHEDEYGQTAALDYAGPYRLVLFLPSNPMQNPLQNALVHGFDVPLGSAPIDIELPRIHLKSDQVLTAPLRKLGMVTAFGPLADFSPMLGTREAGQGVIFQNIDLKIDEHGTTAKALTEFPGKVQSLRRFRAVHFDRPFAFEIVRDGEHPATLFEGQVLDIRS